MPVARKLRCSFRRCGEGRKFSGRRDAELIQLLGVHHAGVDEVRQHRLIPVNHLQHQEIGDLRGRAPAGRGHASAERFTALVEQPEQLRRDRRQAAGRPHLQDRGDEVVVEHDLLIGAALHDVRERHARVGFGRCALEQQTRAQRRHFEQRWIAAIPRGVGRVEFADLEAQEIFTARRAADFELAGPAQRHRQVEPLIPDVRTDVDRRRQRVVVRHAEGGAVGEHAGEATQADLADLQKIPLELDFREPPAVRDQRLAPAFDIPLEVAILLLKMLGLKEQPFRPDDAVVSRHGRVRHNLQRMGSHDRNPQPSGGSR